MKRIAVIGAGGAGKTHLARTLGRRRRRPALLAELNRWSHSRTVVVLCSRHAVKRFIAQLPPA
jgi:adenylate kinase family enzyme